MCQTAGLCKSSDQTANFSLTFRMLHLHYSGMDESADSHFQQYVLEKLLNCCLKVHISESRDSYVKSKDF